VNAYQDLNDGLWGDKYNQVVSTSKKGTIVNVDGIGDKDSYNPMLCEYNGSKVLAFRCESRNSQIDDTINYHPVIMFAKQDGHIWKVDKNIVPFEMLEDPMFMKAKIHGHSSVVFGGVRARLVEVGNFVADTELYEGDTLETVERTPFAVIKGMKDERLCQLPDGRFLLCRRPLDNHGLGRAVLHIVDHLDDLTDINVDIDIPPAVAVLQGPNDNDWVGINSIYIISDKHGTIWVGLLGHIGALDDSGGKHYAATTYKVKLNDLVGGKTHIMDPTIIAMRSCFEDGPQKDDKLSDVVFPGSLEKIEGNRYRLWAGLSDARIGIIELDDPFRLD